MNNPSKWLKREIQQFNRSRIGILRELKFQDVINRRSAFIRSGEITNAGEIVYHNLDYVISDKGEPLFEALSQKLQVASEQLGHLVAEQDYEFQKVFDKTLNRFTLQFLKEFCVDGIIDWRKLSEL